jgi:hypothetical protein
LTISTGVKIKPSGYRIFGTGTFTMNGTALIEGNGNNGGNGVDGGGSGGHAGGPGGAALPDGYLRGSPKGGDGGLSEISNSCTNVSYGENGVNCANSLGDNASAAGSGACGPGSAGVATPSNVKLIANWHLATLLDVSSTGSTVKFNPSAGAGGGGGAQGWNGNGGGGGGGSGSGGRIIAIYFKNIVIGASSILEANGGNGGNGGSNGGGGTPPSGGGGGAGANGGIIILVYNTITNSGSILVNGGNYGLGGSPNGQNGSIGTAGHIYYFQLSL